VIDFPLPYAKDEVSALERGGGRDMVTDLPRGDIERLADRLDAGLGDSLASGFLCSHWLFIGLGDVVDTFFPHDSLRLCYEFAKESESSYARPYFFSF